jgi:maltose O-acetyltransferase
MRCAVCDVIVATISENPIFLWIAVGRSRSGIFRATAKKRCDAETLPKETGGRLRPNVRSPEQDPLESSKASERAGRASQSPGLIAALAVSRALPHLAFNRTRTALLRAAGLSIGPRSWMMGPLDITGPGDPRVLFSIDADTLLTGPLHVELSEAVRIGKHVQLGHHVYLVTREQATSSHGRERRLLPAPIAIGDGAWIGSRATILGGSRIGAGSIVAAGAVVGGDVPANTLVAGVPARPIRDLDEEAPRSVRRERTVFLVQPGTAGKESGAGGSGEWERPSAPGRLGHWDR